MTKDGTGNQIDFTTDEVAKIKAAGENLISTHNHPGQGVSFSEDDVRFAILTNAGEVRVVGQEYIHSMRRPADGWPAQKQVETEYRLTEREVRDEFESRVNAGDMTAEKANKQFHHEVWRRLAEILNLDYSRGWR